MYSDLIPKNNNSDMQNIGAYTRRTRIMKSARGLSYEAEGPRLMKLSAAINPPLLVQRSVTRGQGVDYQRPVSQRRIQQPRPTHINGRLGGTFLGVGDALYFNASYFNRCVLNAHPKQKRECVLLINWRSVLVLVLCIGID